MLVFFIKTSCFDSSLVSTKNITNENLYFRGLKIKPMLCPGGTDARFVREFVPALGFSPLNFTEIRIHEHNEYVNKNVFLKGIDVYAAIIPSLANVTVNV